jgi:two-component system response regulator NreC
MVFQLLIVDDRAVVRKELRHLLELTGRVAVIGEAADGREAVRQAEALEPDIVLMDLEMPGLDGFEATRQIKVLRPACAVIVFTVYGDPFSRQRALDAGADAFIVKGADLSELLASFEHFAPGQENGKEHAN